MKSVTQEKQCEEAGATGTRGDRSTGGLEEATFPDKSIVVLSSMPVKICMFLKLLWIFSDADAFPDTEIPNSNII